MSDIDGSGVKMRGIKIWRFIFINSEKLNEHD